MGVGSGPTARLLAVSLASGLREVNQVREGVVEGVLVVLNLIHRVERTVWELQAPPRNVASIGLPAMVASPIAVTPIPNGRSQLGRWILGIVRSRARAARR